MTYVTVRTDRRTVAVQVRGGEVIVRAPKRFSDGQVARFVEKHTPWIEKKLAEHRAAEQRLSETRTLDLKELAQLKARAKSEIPPRVAHYAELIGVSYGRITVRAQRTRWGSCNAKGDLSFNCLLMLAPQEVLDSVIVHELCHRKEMNHSNRFYAEVLRVYPDYHKHHAYLKEHGAEMQMRLGEK